VVVLKFLQKNISRSAEAERETRKLFRSRDLLPQSPSLPKPTTEQQESDDADNQLHPVEPRPIPGHLVDAGVNNQAECDSKLECVIVPNHGTKLSESPC